MPLISFVACLAKRQLYIRPTLGLHICTSILNSLPTTYNVLKENKQTQFCGSTLFSSQWLRLHTIFHSVRNLSSFISLFYHQRTFNLERNRNRALIISSHPFMFNSTYRKAAYADSESDPVLFIDVLRTS